jgi:hypothetical protein
MFFLIAATLRTGKRLYLANQCKTGSGVKFTASKRHARKYSDGAQAEDAVQRYHRVQSEGQHWQEVQFFEPIPQG